MRALGPAGLGLLLAACGGGLYDAAGLPETAPAGGAVCAANMVICPGDATRTCADETADRCGTACAACPAGPVGTTVTCNLGRAPDGHGQCGYACADGYFACATAPSGCCAATAVAAGGDSSYARVSDGSIRAWGGNDRGQLGDGSTVDRAVPAIAVASGAATVAAGPAHACAIVAGGAVVCWGANPDGRVTGATASATEPSPVATPVTSGAVAVAAGGAHTCALLDTGAVTCWGAAAQTAGAASISGATALAAGDGHTCALVAGGAVRCWGANDAGQLGGAPAAGIATPIASGIQLLAASGAHTCAATGGTNGQAIDDAVRCWGDVLGPDHLFSSPQPTPAIPMKSASQSTIRYAVDRLATGGAHVCVRGDLNVSCFGAAAPLVLGGAPPAGEKADVPGIGTAPAISTGASHSCALLADGSIRCWGENGRGQMGDGRSGPGANPAVGTLVAPKGT